MKLPYHTLSLALALALPGIAAAEQAPTELDDVIVTATRTPVSIADSVVPVQVIDREQIDRSQAGSVLDLLRGRAGLDFANQGGAGKLTSLFMRGTASNQVLVLVDGVRIGAATSGMPALQDLPIDQIERVEIVRGPRSSLYGSEAIGGVIQIFTRSAGKGLQQNLALTAGSHNLRQASAGFSNRGERGWVSAQGAWQKTDGINACNGSAALFQGCYVDEPDRDGYRNASLNLRGGYALAETLSVEGHVLDASSRNEYDGSIYSGNEAENHQQVYGGKLLWTPGEAFRLSAQVGRNNDQADSYFADAGKRTFVSTFDTRRDTASVQGDVLFAEGQQLTAGADWQKDEVTGTTAYAIDSRDNTGVFAEYQGRFGAHSLQASVRNDDNEQFGNHTTGSLGYGFAFGNGLRLTASAGTGFKAPTFNDLYYPWSSNPELNPEESKSVNVGIAQYADGWNWTFNAYETRIDQLIALDSTYTPYNIAKARIRGAELTGFVSLAGFDINAQASFTDPRDHTSGATSYDNWLPRRARTSGRLDVDRGFGPLRVGVTATGTGHRFDNAANSMRLAGYGTVDLRVEYAINEAWSLQAKAANVFDREYETVAWYNQPGREYQLTLRYRSR
ncbi:MULTISPECIES: TonB-dependent vitamin B12 receptor [Stenotrophomonas]|uniref:TonB-dependent receptor n=1 Tax=Stenotrophomonas nitritireducens TaxID=83617 RepID=A0ABR5NGS3_9GAMM|nr:MULTISPECIES: TonB-dependent vitamin B12 receptor [Stenotrophomonas]KQN95908.1 TonB-dependent receptor [Stenotrophomonas sp. Leaf70]KRG55031.1 TonB-dependent receptor [Stenotrophomonas nitritireducens]